MDDAACDIIDDRLQMAIMRDPRAMAVSAYFHRVTHESGALNQLNITSIDDHFVKMLPALCRWTSVRYKLFSEMLSDRTAMYWYGEPLEHPWRWHRHFLKFLGLRVPDIVLKNAVFHATKGTLVGGLGTKGELMLGYGNQKPNSANHCVFPAMFGSGFSVCGEFQNGQNSGSRLI